MRPKSASLGQVVIDICRLIIYKIRRLHWKLLCKLGPTVTVDTEFGKMTVISNDHAVGWRIFETRQYEKELIDNVIKLVRSFPTTLPIRSGNLLDIGANIGMTSIGLINQGHVRGALAIEPEPLCYSLLNQNVEQNDMTQEIITMPVALSVSAEEIELEIIVGDYGFTKVAPSMKEKRRDPSDYVIQKVQAYTLDAILRQVPQGFIEDIALVWIDVEGYEARVFEGGQKFLRRRVPVVAEFYPRAMTVAGVEFSDYAAIVQSLWTSYWVLRGGKFVKYPVDSIGTLWDEYSENPQRTHTNIVLTQ